MEIIKALLLVVPEIASIINSNGWWVVVGFAGIELYNVTKPNTIQTIHGENGTTFTANVNNVDNGVLNVGNKIQKQTNNHSSTSYTNTNNGIQTNISSQKTEEHHTNYLW